LKPRGKKSLNIDAPIHKAIKMEGVRRECDMSDVIAEAWALYLAKHPEAAGSDGGTNPTLVRRKAEPREISRGKQSGS
jgi:hypothetical protein